MKKTQNGTLKNLVYLVLIIVLFVTGTILLASHYTQARTSFNFNPIYATLISIVCFGAIGVLLGLSNTNVPVERTRHIDKSRLLLLALPSFIISMSHIWAILELSDFFNKSIYPYMLENNYIIIVSSIILGHSVFTSFVNK